MAASVLCYIEICTFDAPLISTDGRMLKCTLGTATLKYLRNICIVLGAKFIKLVGTKICLKQKIIENCCKCGLPALIWFVPSKIVAKLAKQYLLLSICMKLAPVNGHRMANVNIFLQICVAVT